MLRLVAFVVVSLTILAAAPVHAETAAPKPASVIHYRALEKMLGRFSRQAGSPSTARVLASR